MTGSAGFKGPPDADGMVEIAYGVVPAFQRRGYATEMAKALVDYAVVVEPDDGPVWRWERTVTSS